VTAPPGAGPPAGGRRVTVAEMTRSKALAIWGFALAAAAAAVALVFTSDHATTPVATAALTGSAGIAFVTAGLIAWTIRPRNGTGRLMTLVGLASFLGALSAANDATLFTLGVALGSIVYAVFLHFVLAYPAGRLEGLLSRALVAATWALVTVAQVAALLVTPSEDLCGQADCPENRLLVTEADTVAAVIHAVVQLGAIAIAATTIGVLVGRYRRASPAHRRSLAPVYLASALTLLALLLAFLLSFLSQTFLDTLSWVAILGLLSVPLASLYGLVERRLSRAAVSRLVVEIGEGEPAGVEEAARAVLHDPTLLLVRWDGSAWTSEDGTPVELTAVSLGRAVTPVARHGEPVAAMVHDPSLLDNRDLLDAVAAAVAMSIENERRFDELRRSETRTRALLDAIPDLMFRIARDGRYLDFRAESTRDLYDVEVLGRSVQERLPAPVAQRILRAGERALATGEVQSFEYELEIDGEGRTYEGRAVASGGDEFILIVRDFTHRRRREEAVERSEARTRALLDAIPDLMFRIGDDGIYRGYKADDPNLLLMPPEEFLGRRVADVLPRPVADQIMSCGRRALEGGRPEPIEYDLELRGQRRSFEGRIARVDEDEFLLIVRDFTERRRQEQELLGLHRQLEERLGELERERDLTDRVVNGAPSVLILLDDRGGILRVNRRAVELLGYVDRDARVHGKPFWDVFVPREDREAARTAFRGMLRDRSLGEQEARWETATGEELVVSWSATPLPEEDGVPRTLLAAQDITHRAHQQEELAASRARLVQAADDARRRLERNLHDGAQQRLVSLSLALRLAQARLEKGDADGADSVLGSAREELALALEELRELARGIHPAVLTERGLGPALEALAARAPLPVAVEAPAERLPEPVEAAAYFVVSEALANVAKYARATEATVRVARDDGRVVVEVRDDGIGGAEAGSGSGLRGLGDRVAALRGALHVDSPRGAGTVVRAEIPLST
jgi:PAS domain S-box-containing protein